MKLNNIVFGDNFIKLKEELAAKGEIADFDLQAYAEELMNSILYWDGERFVNEPTVNLKYAGREYLP